MQGQCDQYPQRFVMSRGKVQFRYNIREIETGGEMGGTPKAAYRYDYVEADAPTRQSILDAMAAVPEAETILDDVGEITIGVEPNIHEG